MYILERKFKWVLILLSLITTFMIGLLFLPFPKDDSPVLQNDCVIFVKPYHDPLLQYVSHSNLISQDFIPDDLELFPLASNGEQYLPNMVNQDLQRMFLKAQQDGISLYLISGYRSYDQQKQLYDYYLEKYGQTYVDETDDYPAGSEHQLGLGVDLGDASRQDELELSFENTDAFAWLFAHSTEFGFILRYPKGSQHLTGLSYHPWHFRYVGTYARQFQNGIDVFEEKWHPTF